MAYFSLLYETKLGEDRIKTTAKKQWFLKAVPDKQRNFELVGSKMVEIKMDPNKDTCKFPAFFKDLNLDQVIEKIILEDTDTMLKETFYELLQTKEEITYRQDIFRDLEKPAIYQSILKFYGSLSQVKQFIDYSEKANHPLQSCKYRLDAMNLYYNSILCMLLETSQNVDSAGLNNMITLLKEYAISDTFHNLSNMSLSLKDKIESIHYNLTILPDKIMLHFKNEDNDFSEKLKNVFFPNQNYQNNILFFRQVTLTDLELKIADVLYRKEKGLFTDCSEFTAKHSDFIDPRIIKLYRELKFYISCHTYIYTLKSKQFSFCYPEILTNRKLELQGFYDLVLAYKSKISSDIITNDILLDETLSGAWITGANQGGKTTFARCIGQIAYFMLIGLPVPGRFARLPLFSGIFTHFSTEETTLTGNGKLKEELLRIKEMLSYVNNRDNLYILNELFSSTTTLDAYDMNKLLIQRLISNNSSVICVTHIPSLAASCKEMLSLGTKTGTNEKNRRTFRIIPKAAEPTAYASDISNRYHLTYKQIKEELEHD